MYSLLREPLLHFAVAGALIFILFAVIEPDPAAKRSPGAGPAAPDTRIVIDEAIAARLAGQFQAVWSRPPSAQELSGLIDGFVTEEVLVREALALGLDADDAVVRQRLRLKMEFLLEAGASAETPDDAMLESFLAENAQSFATPPRLGFAQVFLGEDAAPEFAAAALERLRSGADPATVGQRSLLPARVPGAPEQAVDGTFGQGVFEALAGLPEGIWSGPIRSGYGDHLVRIDVKQPGRRPPLAEIRDDVERAWRAAQAERARRTRLAELRDYYTVERLIDAPVPAP